MNSSRRVCSARRYLQDEGNRPASQKGYPLGNSPCSQSRAIRWDKLYKITDAVGPVPDFRAATIAANNTVSYHRSSIRLFEPRHR